jgi:hypothetical protein
LVLHPAISNSAAAIRRFIAAVLPSDLSLTDGFLWGAAKWRVEADPTVFLRFKPQSFAALSTSD